MRDHRQEHPHKRHFHEHHFHEDKPHPERGHAAPDSRGHHGQGGEPDGHFGGPRGRARRGEARYILLDALREGPRHGYEIIKALEERSGGRYAPSPGTVYPTLQYLEDMGLVRSDQETERRVFHLTDPGRADLQAHTQDIADFWARFAGASAAPANQAELRFLREDVDDLARTVWEGAREPLSAGDLETVRQIRAALTRCRSEIREIVTAVIITAAEGEKQ